MSQIRALVVDDNQVNCLVACAMLQDRGIHVDVATSAQQAAARAADGGYAVIFMDLRLPGEDGYAATRAIRALDGDNREIPILALTAEVASGTREACLAAGMNDVISKPLLKPVLDAALWRWCGIPLPQAAAVSAAPDLAGTCDLDKRVLDELRAMMAPVSFWELVARFDADTKDRIARLQAAALRGDHREVQEQAHTIKSAAALFGARALADAAFTLERIAAGRGDTHAAVQSVCDRAAAARAWLARAVR